MITKPSRHSQPWTDTDDQILRLGVELRKDIMTIAADLGRGAEAVESRCKTLRIPAPRRTPLPGANDGFRSDAPDAIATDDEAHIAAIAAAGPAWTWTVRAPRSGRVPLFCDPNGGFVGRAA